MHGEFMVGLNREVREGAGVAAGDNVTLELTLDTAPRTVDVPPALAEALDSDPEAKATFEGLAFTHRKPVFAQPRFAATRLLNPPYGKTFEQVLALLRKLNG